MRCKACNTVLEDNELTRKDRHTGGYVDLCDDCYDVSEDCVNSFFDDELADYEDDDYDC